MTVRAHRPVSSASARSFGAARAVDDVSFDIARGEFFSLLGPSGCGKTTTLRLLAGFEDARRGRRYPDRRGAGLRLPSLRARRSAWSSRATPCFPTSPWSATSRSAWSAAGCPAAESPRRVAEALELVRLDPGEFARAPAHASSPAGSASGWRSPGRWCSSPRCSCSTSRSAPSITSSAATMQLELRQLNRTPRDHLRLRHPRSGRSAHHVGPDRGDGPRPRSPSSGRPRRSTSVPAPHSSPLSSASPTCFPRDEEAARRHRRCRPGADRAGRPDGRSPSRLAYPDACPARWKR